MRRGRKLGPVVAALIAMTTLVLVGLVLPAAATGETIAGTVRDPDGHPVAGVRVSRIGPGTCPFSCTVVTTTTATNGTYSFPNSTEPSYFMAWAPPSSRPDLVELWSGGVLGPFRYSVPAPYAPVATVPNDTVVVDAVLPFGGTISGHVTYADGKPALGARVRATFATAGGAVGPSTAPGAPVATVDGDGNYTLTGLPANAGLVGAGAASYTLDVVPPFQSSPVPGLVLPATGTYEIFAGTAITGADAVVPGAAPVSGTASIYQGGVKLTQAQLPSTTTGAGFCVAPALFDPSSFCANPAPSPPTFSADGTQLIGPLAPGTYTVRGVQAFVSGSPLNTTMTLAPGDSFHCRIPLDSSITPECVVSSTGPPTGDGDGASVAAEDGAPGAGDGNGDGTSDSVQAHVASLPDPTGGYATVASLDGHALGSVTVTDPASLAGPLPPGLDTGTGLVGYRVAVPTGATTTVDVYVDDPTATLDHVWKVVGGTPVDATALVQSITHLGDGRTRVRIALTDGGPGDADGTADGTIVDPLAFGTAVATGPTFSIGDASAVEGDTDARTLLLPVTLSEPQSTTASVAVTIHGDTATGGSRKNPAADFDDRRGVTKTLTFTAGPKGTPTTRYVTVPVYGDTADEGDEAFTVTLSAPSSGLGLGHAEATGTIVDDDATPKAGVEISAGAVTIDEGTTGRRAPKLALTLSAPASGEVRVDYTIVSGTATCGPSKGGLPVDPASDCDDAKGVTRTAVFKVRATKGTTAVGKSVTTFVFPDTATEGLETFTVQLSNPSGASIRNGAGTVTIRDDD